MPCGTLDDKRQRLLRHLERVVTDHLGGDRWTIHLPRSEDGGLVVRPPDFRRRASNRERIHYRDTYQLFAATKFAVSVTAPFTGASIAADNHAVPYAYFVGDTVMSG